MYLSACENPGSSLEESVEPFLELQAIEGASNVTMVVNRGEAKGLDSYFAFEVRNIKSNGVVREGLKEGWCLEWNKPIRQNNDIHSGVEMYNTSGSKAWKPANYLMNIKDELKASDPDLTYREIQVALWSLIEEPRFNLDKILENDQMPSRLLKNGQPNFSVEKVKNIVDRVRSEVPNYEVKPGSPFMAFYHTGGGQQNGGHEITCDGFRTQTPGGWGAQASGNNNGTYRDANFNNAFPNGLTIGGDFTLSLTSASAVEAFLPSGGGARILTENVVDPGRITGRNQLGTLAGHIIALTLAIGFDDCINCTDFGSNDFSLKNLIFQKGEFKGKTVQYVLNEANRIFGGGAMNEYTANELNDIITVINENYVDGNSAIDPNLLGCSIPEIEI